MICTCIQNKNYSQILEILSLPDVEMAEIRLDLCPLSDEEIEDLFANSDLPLIACCRMGEDANQAERKLLLAIRSGARFADLEIDAPAPMSKAFQRACRDNGTEIIRSYHNFSLTPSDEELQMVLARCFRYGADIAKIVCKAENAEDCKRLAALYSIVLEDLPSLQGRLVAFGMGEKCQACRIDCLKRGAPFTYAALNNDEIVSAGQMNYRDLSSLIYGGKYTYHRSGIEVPASKSFAQRAILAAALAGGESVLNNYTSCGDTDAALALVKSLGAKLNIDKNKLKISGISTKAGFCVENIDAGESGLLARLAIPLLSVLNSGDFTISGRGTLLSRPLYLASDIMASYGVLLSGTHIPLKVKGKLIPGTANVPGEGGSQLISGLLMALPLCKEDSTLFVSNPKSLPYMYMTLDVLKKFGIQTRSEMEGDAELLESYDWSACSGIKFNIKGNQSYKPAEFDIEKDWSAAAVYLVAGAVFGSAQVQGLDMQSIQADLTIIDILVEAGAMVSKLEDGTVCCRKAPLEAFSQDLSNAPDLFPVVCVLAAFCSGESRLDGVGRLSGKESNRALSILEMLSKMGVEARIEGDSLYICGESLAARILGKRLLKGGSFSSHHDHRMVMALELASIGAGGTIEIDDTACVEKSFPDFRL